MPLLQAKNVTHYFGGLCAVSDFNLDLEKGELIGIIGPNGAGKTTVFNLITGVYKATEGEILFDGTPLVGMRPNRITSLGIARTFQNIRLWQELSVLDNVRIANYTQIKYGTFSSFFHSGNFAREEDRTIQEAMDLLAVFKLEDYADETSKNLPYGLQRRLEIARAMATEPFLLLLDEPAAGMNAQETRELDFLIEQLRNEENISILLIEHDMKLVMRLCDRIYVVDYGKKIAAGTPREISRNPEVIKAYLGEEVDA